MFLNSFFIIMNSFLIVSIVSLLSAVLIVALKVCFASKCDKIEIRFGLIKINREVELEHPEFTDSSNVRNQEVMFIQRNNEKSKVEGSHVGLNDVV